MRVEFAQRLLKFRVAAPALDGRWHEAHRRFCPKCCTRSTGRASVKGCIPYGLRHLSSWLPSQNGGHCRKVPVKTGARFSIFKARCVKRWSRDDPLPIQKWLVRGSIGNSMLTFIHCWLKTTRAKGQAGSEEDWDQAGKAVCHDRHHFVRSTSNRPSAAASPASFQTAASTSCVRPTTTEEPHKLIHAAHLTPGPMSQNGRWRFPGRWKRLTSRM